MESSPTVISIGAVCFGLVVGFITYRTLVFKDGASISDISAVIAAVGGGAVAVWFDRAEGDSFAWYSIGLLGGLVLYYLHTSLRGSPEIKAKLSGGQRISQHRTSNRPATLDESGLPTLEENKPRGRQGS